MDSNKKNVVETFRKPYVLKDFCKKCIVKNTDKKHSLVFTNSAIYGIVKQADYFEKDVANSDNTDSYYVVNTKDFIYNPRISENAPYGPIRTNETGEVGIVSPLYFVFRIADETIADYNFLKYYFTSSNWHRYVYSIGNNGARSDRMNISDADFMAMPVALPPLEEQRRIAEILGCCDRVITLKKELIAEKKKQKKALMQKLLNPDSGFRLPVIREKITQVHFNDICRFINGRAYSQDELLETGKYRVLRVGNLFTSDTWYFSNLELPNDKYCQKDDLLYAWSASFGPFIWQGETTIYHYHIWNKLICSFMSIPIFNKLFSHTNRT